MSHRYFVAPVLALLIVLTAAVYWSGLNGPFLFDDFINLADLGKFNGVRNLETLSAYLAGGSAGPLGRPVALLSFLIDDYTWPSVPRPFKLTNLELHLLTGLLLAWLGVLLARELARDDTAAAWTGLLGAGLWLLHPLWVSTTLFVVQRMTILAALFTLAALIGYLKGRQRLAAGRPASGYALMSAGTGAFGLLAVFSKENAALLPVFVVLIEYLVFRPEQRRGLPGWWLWRWCLWLPVAVLASYFALQLSHDGSFPNRPFDRAERLLTEGRILVEYLYQLAVPRMQTGGLYHDDYPISHGLLDPPTTLAALLFIAALIGAAFYWRRTAPAAALGVLFFFAGHLIESTLFPLELYFEHRNYLPSMLLFFSLGYSIVALYRRYRLPAAGLAGALLVIYSGLTWSRAALWGDPLRLAMVWAEQAPYSVRAQEQGSLALTQAGRPDLARGLLDGAVQRLPDSAELRLQVLIFGCVANSLGPVDFTAGRETLRTTQYHPHLYFLLEKLVELQERHACHGLSARALDDLIDTLAANPTTRAWRTGYARMFHLQGRLYLSESRYEAALQAFDRAFDIVRDDDFALVQAAMMASAGQHALALEHLRAAREQLATAHASGPWRERLDELETAILTHMPNNPPQIP